MFDVILRAHTELTRTEATHERRISNLREAGHFLRAEREECGLHRATKVLLGSLWMWTGSLADGPDDETLARIRYVVRRYNELDKQRSNGFDRNTTLAPLVFRLNMALKVLYTFWIPKRSTGSHRFDLPLRGAEALVAESYGFFLYAGYIGDSRWRQELNDLLPWPDEVVDWCHPSQHLFEVLKAKNLLSSEQQHYADTLNALMPDWKRRSEYISSIAIAY